MCAERILTERAKEVSTAVGAHGHKRVVMATFTLRHARGHSLYALRRLLTDSYSAMKAGRAGRLMRKTARWVGDIRGAEMTHGKNGWHPHLHTLWFLGGKAEPLKLERLLSEAWTSAVRRTFKRIASLIFRCVFADEEKPVSWRSARAVFGARFVKDERTNLRRAALGFYREWRTLGNFDELVSPDEQHGVKVTRCDEQAARYISKFGLEVSAVTSKTANQYHRTTWQIAADAADGDMTARALWAEHSRVMIGARQMTWSRGLRKILGLLPERSDEELSRDLPTEDERSIGRVNNDAWDEQARSLGQEWLARLYEAHATGQLGQIAAVETWVTPWDVCETPPEHSTLQTETIPGTPNASGGALHWSEELDARKRGRKRKLPAPPEQGITFIRFTPEERRIFTLEASLTLAEAGLTRHTPRTLTKQDSPGPCGTQGES